jgi:hypothetical protein
MTLKNVGIFHTTMLDRVILRRTSRPLSTRTRKFVRGQLGMLDPKHVVEQAVLAKGPAPGVTVHKSSNPLREDENRYLGYVVLPFNTTHKSSTPATLTFNGDTKNPPAVASAVNGDGGSADRSNVTVAEKKSAASEDCDSTTLEAVFVLARGMMQGQACCLSQHTARTPTDPPACHHPVLIPNLPTVVTSLTTTRYIARAKVRGMLFTPTCEV